MIHQIVAIRDKAMEQFNRPIFIPAIGAAIRMIQDETNRPDSELNKHPGDYDLYHLGTWDDQNAAFTPLEKPTLLANCAQLLNMERTNVQK